MNKDHKLKSGKVEVRRSYCAEPTCKFYKKPAEQGVCFNVLPDATTHYLNELLKSGEHLLNEAKTIKTCGRFSTRKWIEHLEGMVICTWASNSSMLDELIMLRGENAKLRAKQGKGDAKRGRKQNQNN